MQTLLNRGGRRHVVAGEARADSPAGLNAAGRASSDVLTGFSPPLEEEGCSPRPIRPSNGNAQLDAMEASNSDFKDARGTSRWGRGNATTPPLYPGAASHTAVPSSSPLPFSTSSEGFSCCPPPGAGGPAVPAFNVEPGWENHEADGSEKKHAENQLRRSKWLSPPRQPVRFRLPVRLTRGSSGHSRRGYVKRGGTTKRASSQSFPDSSNALHRSWDKLKAAGSAAPGANAAAAAGKHAARLGREAAKRSAMKAAKAVKVLKAVQGELDSAARLQRMLGIQKYTEDECLQQFAETGTFLSPGESLQYDLKVLQYYTNTEKDIELRNRRAKSFIYSPAAQIVMAMVIIFNILFLGISTMEISIKTEETEPPQSHHDAELVKWNKALFIFLTVCNAFFAVIFFAEMVLRIKCDRLAYFKDIVNITDFVNAWLGIVDLFFTALHYMERVELDVFQSVAAVLRLVRLLRVLRFIRILKAFLPMRVLVDGMKASFFSLVYAMCFFIVLVYGFAVFFTTAFGTTRALQEYWGDLFTSMYTLFLILTMTNWDVVAAKTAAYYGWAKAVVILYTVFSFFVLFNVVTAVIVEAFSSAASRLQGEAMHFAMFDECQEDEKTFSKALTKGHLLSAVSGISLNKRHLVTRPSLNAAYNAHHTYREPAEHGGSDLLDSTKSTQVVAPAAAPEVGKQEGGNGEEGGAEAGDAEGQRAAEEVYDVSPEGPAVAPTNTPTCRRKATPYSSDKAEPTNAKPRALNKFPSSLFSSFVRPSSSLVQHKDSRTPPKRPPQKRLRCVRGILATQTANVPDRAEHKDGANDIKELLVTPQPHEILLFPTAPAVEQPDAAGLQASSSKKDLFSPPDGENASAIPDAAPSTPAEKKKLRQSCSDVEQQSVSKALGGMHISEDFIQTSAAREANGSTKEPFVGVLQAGEGFSNSQAAAIGEEVDDFAISCGRIYDEGLLPACSLKTVPEAPQGMMPCIDLRRFSPLQVLGTRAVQLAMRKCGISYIQAYDCLNILLQKGFQEVTVAGFLTCCRRVVGRPTARQLFLLELDLDRAFRHLNEKMTRLLSLVQLFTSEEGLIALPSTFSTGTTKSGLLS